MSEVVAIACADVHLSHRPPVARSAESDWYVAMSRPLAEINALVMKYQVPVLCAGDVFDKWNSPPELINFAIGQLPKMTSIAGQHDLPNHNYGEIRKSAFWTLVLSRNILSDMLLDGPWANKGFDLYGFSWGQEVKTSLMICGKFRLKTPKKHDRLNIAVIHDYLWADGIGGYPGAPEEKKAENREKQLEGYDIAIFGDNHTPFEYQHDGPLMFNCGSLMRRTIDQVDHKPSVGLVYSDGTIKRHYLDCSQDRFIDDEIIDLSREDSRVAQFVDSLDTADVDSIDFHEMIKTYIRTMQIEGGTKKILKEVLDSAT